MGEFGRVDPESWEMTGSALAVAVPSDTGDTQLCYVCHGVDALGSGTPVGAAFEETSAHSLAPVAAPFGPSEKHCSSCHDSHGADDETTGTPYSRLLRSRTTAGAVVFEGSAYCGTCHTGRPASTFDEVAIYEQTGHYTAMPDPADGTEIRCLQCHRGHGSPIAPIITQTLLPPAAPATETVTANDRTFCLACHPDPLGTYPVETTYTLSAHAASSVLVTVTGEWAETGAQRLVGECQVCHAPMGLDDGTGAPIVDLLRLEGSALCASCHDTDGPAATDLSVAEYPASAATHLELAAAFSPETTTAAFGTLAVWGSDAADTAPRDLVGPRFYPPADLTGEIAVGDVDGQEGTDVVVADPGADTLTVFIQDPLKGLTSYFGPGVIDLGADVDVSLSGMTAEHVLVADVLADPDDLPEVLLLDADAGELHALRWDILGAAFDLIDTQVGLGSQVTGMATGDLDADGLAEVVVTDAEPAARVRVVTGGTGSLSLFIAPIAAKQGVRGASVGDIDDAAGIEFAVANADEAVDQVTVYDATGAELASYSVDATSGARAWDTLIADVLPGTSPAGTSGLELSVAVNGAADLSAVNVFAQLVGGGLDTPQRYDTGFGYTTGSLAAGDIDGDGDAELVAGSGGAWSRDPALATAPSVRVFQHNAGRTAFTSTQDLRAGGVERAGAPPALVVADLGGVGPSRHPVGVVEDAHLSTETPTFTRHVDCADCHDPHEATSTVSAAPTAYGLVAGTFGTTVTNTGPGTSITYGDSQPIDAEYQLCLKCHSAYATATGLEGASNIAAEVNAQNASVHAVEQGVTAAARTGSFVAGWDNDSVLFCIDCHSAAGAPAVSGPHASSEAPVLVSPYLGVTPSDSAGLCYDCHRYTVYYTGADDAGASASWFVDTTDGPLHALHVQQQGFGCASCHESHGSPGNERLVRDVITFAVDGTGGSCTGPCHPLGVTYVR